MDQRLNIALKEQLQILRAAVTVLGESEVRVRAFEHLLGTSLSVEQRESCEALTARFASLNDLLLQRLFRTIDAIELVDEGTALDRIRRMEKRGIVRSADRWRELRFLRNQIAHEYLIESADEVLRTSLAACGELVESARNLEAYAVAQGYLPAPDP